MSNANTGHARKLFSGNRGEWSEPYTVLRLLSDGQLSQADDNLTPSPLDFAKVTMIERGDFSAFVRSDNTVVFEYFNKLGQHHTVEAGRSELGVDAKRLFKAIAAFNPDAGAFSLSSEETRLRVFGFSQLTNPPVKGNKVPKRDLTLRLQSLQLGDATLGFSVKSELGAPPSLLNASKATNIIFRIKGLSQEIANNINRISGSRKIMERSAAIVKHATSIEYEGYNNQIFEENLDVVDSALPKMIADLVKVHYFKQILEPRKRAKGLSREGDRLDRAVAMLSQSSAYAGASRSNYCEIKIKRFLRACALGLLPSEPWEGKDDASGGYIIVLPNGDLMALYVYNTNLFEKYLFENTIFERASTSRHQFMRLDPDGVTGDYLLKLNLQIRFTR